MKKSPFFLFAILALCFVGAIVTGAASVLVISLRTAQIGGALPFFYLEHMNFPALSIALPVVGMLLLALSAPVLLRRREAAEATAVTESVAAPEPAPTLELAEAYAEAA